MPGVEPVSVAPQRLGNRLVASVPEGADRTGPASLLVLRGDGYDRVWYGVQGDRPDSDLTPLEGDRKERILERLSMAEASNWDELNELLQATRCGAERYHWVIIATLAFLIGEMLMQRRFV